MASSIVVVTGAARSGKTTISNILGSCKYVEHVEEPFPLMVLPILAGNGDISESLALQLFRTSLVELLNDRILMRNSNFRPQDSSSIWNQKSVQEILNRLVTMESRQDVTEHLETNPTTLVLTLTDTLPYSDFFWKAVPECQVIHVVRGGLSVAQEVAGRGWFNDEQLLNPTTANPFNIYVNEDNTYYLPYWVESEAKGEFLDSSSYIRSLYYWQRILGLAINQEWYQGNPNLHTIKLHDMVNSSDGESSVINQLIDNLHLDKTELTDSLIAKIYRRDPAILPTIARGSHASTVVAEALALYRHFEIPEESYVSLK